MVLVALDGSTDPIDRSLAPDGVVRWILRRAEVLYARVLEAVRLVVVLQDHVEAQLVQQREHPRVRRIVTRPHRVDVVLLHQAEFVADAGQVERSPGPRVVLVPVHASKLYGSTVHHQQSVGDPYPPESHVHGRRLRRGMHHHGVELRGLRRPRINLAHQVPFTDSSPLNPRSGMSKVTSEPVDAYVSQSMTIVAVPVSAS